MNLQQSPIKLSTQHTKALVAYFPHEAITNRLMNWLFLALVWSDKKYDHPVSRNIFTSPKLLFEELNANKIFPDQIKDIRHQVMFDKNHFDWFEESVIFHLTFLFSINEQHLSTIQPLPLNSRHIETCIMIFDGIIGDRDTKKLFLFEAKERWDEFRRIFEILKWARNGNTEENIKAITSSFAPIGAYQPYVQKYFSVTDQYIDFMVYIFSIKLNQQTAKRLSTEAKKILRQSRPRETKGKSQVNVLISNSTIVKLEKLCKVKNSSKAKLIIELIENYSTYNKEIDAAIQRSKTGVLEVESLNPSRTMQPFSLAKPRRSDIDADNISTATKEEINLPDTYLNTPEQQLCEPSVYQDDFSSSTSTENLHDSSELKIADASPRKNIKFPVKSEEEIRRQNYINTKFSNPSAYKK